MDRIDLTQIVDLVKMTAVADLRAEAAGWSQTLNTLQQKVRTLEEKVSHLESDVRSVRTGVTVGF